ncbi:sigma-70 family RNA polymerase sigma factor [Anabaena sp. CCY 0017]|uniref:sigma-70 family RNA polymerase sigma factor n=1 Tax=Anabaena sp. CCY 0017 TaxID=3103866 RepID=UPI0039C6C963
MHSSNNCLSSVEHQDLSSSFWNLWQEYQNYLYRCCVKWMGNAADGEDALSRAMLKAWEKLHDSTVEVKNFKAWITKLTHNLCVDIHREHHRGAKQVESLEAKGFEYEQELASLEENPVLVVTQQELKNFFCLAIDELSPRLRESFILHFEEELSYKEIAEKLNISYDNVRKRISQARAILKQRYEQDFLGVEDRYSTDLYECKSQAFSQSLKKKIFQKTLLTEAPTGETLTLSDELEPGRILHQEEAAVILRVVVVDSQCDGEVEEIDKISDVNEEYLPLLDVGKFWIIGKHRLSNLVEWFNFQGVKNAQPTIINCILIYIHFILFTSLLAKIVHDICDSLRGVAIPATTAV